MYIYLQPSLPGVTPEAVSGEVTVHVNRHGQCIVGWTVKDTSNDDMRAIGCTSPETLQDGASIADTVLRELLRMLPMLVDAPPFD
jgi:hypothetical protein